MTPNLPEQAADLPPDSQTKSNHACEPERATNHSFLGRKKSQSRHVESRRATSAPPAASAALTVLPTLRCVSAPAAPCSCGKQGLQHPIPLLLVQLSPGTEPGLLSYQKCVCNMESLKGRRHGEPGAPLQHAPTPLHVLR